MSFSPEELLTTSEAAQYLNCSPRTLEKRRANGQEPVFVKDGWSVRYRRSDLDAYLSNTDFIHGSLSDDAVVAKIVATAPRFSAEQRERLLAVLGGAA